MWIGFSDFLLFLSKNMIKKLDFLKFNVFLASQTSVKDKLTYDYVNILRN